MRALDVNYQENLAAILSNYPKMIAEIKKIVGNDIKNINLVGCGANYSQMKAISYLFDGLIDQTDCFLYHAGEIDRKLPARLKDKSVVIGMSHSGNTPEVYYALEKAKLKGAKLIGISSNAQSKLAGIVDQHFQYPAGGQMSELKLLLLLIIVMAIGDAVGNPIPGQLKDELFHLPELFYQAHQTYRAGARQFALDGGKCEMIYAIGSGPTIGPAFAFANCKLMEMQWKDAAVLNASNFFHGPLEVVDEQRYFLLFAAGDRYSDYVRRIRDYLEMKNSRFHLIDARTAYPGNVKLVQEYFTPFLLWPALTVYAWALEEKSGHNLDIRRNMGREGTEYIWA